MVYAAGGERSGNTVQLLDYTQTETWETSKYKYLNQSTEGRSYVSHDQCHAPYVLNAFEFLRSF